jgi:hypothetical protein
MLSKDVIILMTDETYFWLCQWTVFSLLGRRESTAASLTTLHSARMTGVAWQTSES